MQAHVAKKLSTITQAAEELCVSRRFLYSLPKTTPGLVKLGKSLRMDVEQIRHYFERQTRGEIAANTEGKLHA